MFCRNCGQELTGAPEICPKCGAFPSATRNFCPVCGAPTYSHTGICMKCGSRIVEAAVEEVEISPKSRLATNLFAIFLGYFGVHRFYLRKTGSAVGMLILGIIGFSTLMFVVGIGFIIAVGIWALVDFIVAVSGNMKDKNGKPIKKW